VEILNLKQGSDEWIEARLNHFCASEAPAIMGDSKFMSRNQLLDLKKGWKNNPDSSFKQALFQRGHESEDSARVHI
jgi:predicted phage-related endonuclease